MIDKLEYFRDPNFKFDERSHSYTYVNPETGLPIQIFESVSGFISQFKKPFDNSVSKYVAKSRGVTQQEILNEWKELADRGKEVGTVVHKWIEDYYSGLNPEMTGDPTMDHRINLFLKVQQDRLHRLNPTHQELRIFSREWGIAGTVDIIFEMDGKYYVGDWKTNRDFKDDNHPKGKRDRLLHPFDDYWDNNLSGYSLQISAYRIILEEAGFETDGGFLVSLSESGSKLYKTIDFREQLRSYLKKNNFSF
jgi:hypothetical protein